jgi:SagB-type dehydrogenase family enzyme
MNTKRATFFIIVFIGFLVSFAILSRSDCAGEPKGAGRTFHDNTKLNFKNVLGSLVQFRSQPSMTKRYKGYKMISLPKPDFTGEPFEEVLKKRRSVRNYTEDSITLLELSQLLFAAQGITGHEQGYALRAAPSAGALYPMETYVVAIRVDGLKPGIYHYVANSHALELVKSGDFKVKLINASLGQEMVGEAAVTFIITSIFERTTYKYDERGYRYAYMEAGHISQNLFLQSTSLGLGSVCAGAFFDDKINELIGVDGKKEAAIYIHCVGRK